MGGANIGTSVTNTIVAMGHFASKNEFIKPFISPYSKGVANYDKNVAKYVSQGYCNGQCQESLGEDQMKAMTELLCKTKDDGKFDCSGLKGYKDSWMSSGYLYKKRAPLYIMMDEAGKA